MRIKKLILKNFRQFENLELDFTDENGKVLDVVVFAGVNGSGKSTILNFLSEVFSYLEGIKPENLEKIANEYLINEHIEFSIEIELCDGKSEMNDFLNGWKNKSLFKNRTLIIDSSLNKSEEIHKSIERKMGALIEFINAYNENLVYHLKEKTNINIAHLSQRGFIKNIIFEDKYKEDFISFETTEKSILDKLKNMIFDNRQHTPVSIIQNLIVSINNLLSNLKTNTRLVDIHSTGFFFTNKMKKHLDFADLSNGEQQLFFQIFTLHNLHLNNGILLIDEPEDAMHPTWQREILNVYKNIGENNQIFIATHSPHILSSVKPESLFVLNIDEGTGKIKAFNMAKEHKNTKGLDPNRILTEIMGAPLRDYETQQRIDHISALIQSAMTTPNGNIDNIEKEVDELSLDLGRQDYNIMLFRNELMILKRKKAQMANV